MDTLIAGNSLRLVPLEAMNEEQFKTWYELEGLDTEDEPTFMTRKDAEFSQMFNDGLIDVTNAGIDPVIVP